MGQQQGRWKGGMIELKYKKRIALHALPTLTLALTLVFI